MNGNLPLLSDGDTEQLKIRVRRLAEDKSHLQLVIRLMEQLNPLPGMEDMVRSMLENIVQTIGGTNIKLYYWVDDALHYTDFLGESRVLTEIDDPLVAQVIATGEFVERPGAAADALLLNGVIPGAWTWGFPLRVGGENIGAIKLENLHISGAPLRNYLPIFFRHAALILSNEIRNFSRKKAEAALKLAAGVFTHAREGIMITDADGTILDVNAAFTLITGYAREEAVGHKPNLLKSGRHDPEFYREMWRRLTEHGHWHGEVWNRRKDGEVYAELLTVSAVRDAAGAIRHFVALFSDITLQKEYQRRLEHIAHYDALTGLPNRVLLGDRLRQAMAQARRRNLRLAVAYLDLDGFKAVNDQFGHDAGDHLLITLSGRMRQCLREGDTVARLGGDEFVAVLIDLPELQAGAPLILRLLAACSQPVPWHDRLLQVSGSLGVTFYPQSEEVEGDQLLRQADQAMYQAKLAGKGAYHIFDAEHDRAVRHHHETLERIRQGLERREFVLHYQPKVNLRSGEVVGVEALIRWQHPEHGLLPPAAFLPATDEHALGVLLGEWVIDEALRQVAAWQAQGIRLPVSVNVSGAHLARPDFIPRLGELLARHPEVAPGGLELELLESSALANVERVSELIHACAAIGVGFALDDFGVGYSSLAYLKQLPAGVLKIDQSFVRDILEDPQDLAVLEGIISLATAFHRRVLAEGVENIAQGELLLHLGCELAQGYAVAHPMPGADLPGWLGGWRPAPAWSGITPGGAGDRRALFAGIDHRAWIRAVADHLAGRGTEPPQLDATQCDFGRWLASAARSHRWSNSTALRELDELHTRAHQLARELAALAAEGQREEATARVPELEALGDAVLSAVVRLLGSLQAQR